MIKTLLIDNYDSFTFNLYQYLYEANECAPVVVRNDAARWEDIARLNFDNIVISPGPGRPEKGEDFGICAQAITESTVPVLGVCLGHQGFCHLFGSRVDYATEVMHGRPSAIHHNGSEIFEGIPSPFRAIRYHSLVVSELSPSLERIAWTDDGIIMGAVDVDRRIWGVQFHPESIQTEFGQKLLENFGNLTRRAQVATPPRRRKTDIGGETRLPDKTFNVVIDMDRVESATGHGTIDGKAFKIHSRRLPFHVDAEQTYLNNFAGSEASFWLDSALVKGFSRFSYMGDDTGPHAEYVTYDVHKRKITVRRDGESETRDETIFSYLDRELRTRNATVEGLPFDFNLGYVGYLGYELKRDCDADFAYTASTPDAAFVFADRIVAFDHEDDFAYLVCLDYLDEDKRAQAWLDEMVANIRNPEPITPARKTPSPKPIARQFRHSPEKYLDLIRECQSEINRGESYEICLTNMISADIRIDALNTYRVLRSLNPAPYATFLDFPEVKVLSSSPERFLTIDPSGVVESKPIKGTSPRGQSMDEDEVLYQALRTDRKERAENLMIVDLLRNDLGKVCNVGSIHVPKIFAVESYATVHQLVSTVRGRLRRGISAVECVQSSFPGGSMTGAPKKRTMEIIDRLEADARGIYSGSIGFFGLNGSTDLSIVIRTAVVTPDHVSVGVGGAIVALSDPQRELDEMILKSKALITAISQTLLDEDEEDSSANVA